MEISALAIGLPTTRGVELDPWEAQKVVDETEEAVKVAEKALGEAPRKLAIAVLCCGHAIHNQKVGLEQ